MQSQPQQPPGLVHLLRRLASTGVGALRNRLEIFSIELQEERIRIAALLIYATGLVFMAVCGTLMLVATIILLLPADARIYAAGGVTLLFWIGVITLFFALKNLLQKPAFPETVAQVQKDSEWLESLK